MRIVHSADCHGAIDSYKAIRKIGSEQTLFLDSGDTLFGSNTAFRLNEPNLAIMSEIGYHCMTMGNRELHYIPAIMERRASQRSFPLLAANLVELWGRPKTWQDGVSLRLGSLKVGVFGMTVVQYPVGSFYEKVFGLRFLPPETLIEHLVASYQADHDLVIFLSHLGVDWDRRLARQLQAKPHLKCDLILGGHTHATFLEPEVLGHTRLSHIGANGSGYGVWQRTEEDWEFHFVSTLSEAEVALR